jgi:hypothetical protein
MDSDDETTLSASVVSDCERCLSYIDIQRSKLAPCDIYFEEFMKCKKVITALSIEFETQAEVVMHSIALAQRFIVKKLVESGPRPVAPKEPFRNYWVWVSCACYAISFNYHDAMMPELSSILQVCRFHQFHGVRMSPDVKKFWKKLQIRVLEVIDWKLFFPTGFFSFFLYTHQ